MLKNLNISNYALIANLDISFNKGFSVITGETGAGKSIILGALGLVLGQRADTKTIRQGEQKCIIEAEFDISRYNLQAFFDENDLDYSDLCTIRREISVNGKSRSFVNDTPITLNALKQLGNRLLDIHSQHENLLIGNDDFQRQIIDSIAQNADILNSYIKSFREYQEAKKHLDNLIKQAEQEKADQDYVEFQLNQLAEAKLKSGEDIEIENEINMLSHAEELKELLTESSLCLNGEQASIDLLRNTEQNLSKAIKYLPSASELLDRIKSVGIELKDIAAEIDSTNRNVDYDPQRLEQLEERYDLLNTLMAKHHVDTVEQLLEIQQQLEHRLGQITSYDQQIAEAQAEYEKCEKSAENEAAKLSKSRFAIKESTEQHITERLQQLGIKHAQFSIEMTKTEHLTPTGKDQIHFLFAANKNQHLQDVAEVASGGELARLMLCIKSMVANSVDMPTILFDEIDTGVSGDIADRMGQIMLEMSEGRQVISITHLPQIASKGKTHYKVYKADNADSTETQIKQLTPDERIMEIATMLSGNQITQSAINNAKELLKK